MRRVAYLIAAALSLTAHVFIISQQLTRADWMNAAAYTVGLLISAWVLIALTWLRWPTPRLNPLIVVAVTVSTTAEFVPLLHATAVPTSSYLSFLIMVALWFGLLPLRHAAPATVTALAAFTALCATRPTYDLGLLAYLACTTVIIGMASSFGQQITDFQQEAATFERASLTDPLTGLPNRRAMLDHLHHLHAQLLRGEHAGFTLVMLDLDHFKTVNDTRGHATGDAVLRALGPALRQQLRADAVLARWGGEEFLLLISCPGPQEARAVTDRLNGTPLRLPAPLPTVTFSAGAVLAHEADSVSGLLDLADRRLYAAKRAGRRQLRWDTPRDTRLTH
ncbi:GGDEF domain-containing protein [Deinococcus radiotolerans]|uniref:GGDEF domain-containing protein n=1 Tax=Deinococcus radiotolerans TaxID=1309407 RepID=A0ABQ2FJ89_9DEIO|nr:GGDEF domain-containing protein [Deinococcus radiotolerans]